MRIWITAIAIAVAVAACTGDAPNDERACAGNLYDTCAEEHECMSGVCHNFVTQGYQVCATGCTVGNDTPCMTTADGRQATCVAVTSGGTVGICTPPAANACKHSP